jgi:hypothetical protein
VCFSSQVLVIFAALAAVASAAVAGVRPKRGLLPYKVRTFHSAIPFVVRYPLVVPVPRAVPVEVVDHVPVAVPRAVPVFVHKPVAVEVPRAVPIHKPHSLGWHGAEITEAFVPTGHGFKAL